VRWIFGLILLGCGITAGRASDRYEITSVVYLHSNRIEIFLEMDFATGLTLAGQQPTRAVTAGEQFEAALPQLRELAGHFYNFTAGNHVVPSLATNVELGVEDHIQFRVNYANTPHRPLRFEARVLEAASNENPYGTTLTVLDLVNQTVLGQVTLFAATPTAEFPPRPAESSEIALGIAASDPSDTVPLSAAQPAALPAPAETTAPTKMPNGLLPFVTLAAIMVVVFAFCRRRG